MKPGRAVPLLALVLAACDLTPDNRWVGALGAPPFVVLASSLPDQSAGVPLNQPIAVTFSRYLDPDSFQYFDALNVSSGGLFASGFARYRLVDRTLTFFPTRNLVPGLIYSLSVNPDTVRAIGGDPLAVPFSLRFQTAAEGTVEQSRPVVPRSFEADVAPLFEASCSCHRESPELVPLDRASLVDQPSRALPERLLVRPYDAPRSYLMHKLLADYPDRRFSEMPPAWSDAPTLDAEQLGLVEDWIDTGAAP